MLRLFLIAYPIACVLMLIAVKRWGDWLNQTRIPELDGPAECSACGLGHTRHPEL